MPLSSSIHAISQIILGKHQEIKLSICCLLANGHLLIEDVPGVGKTTLAVTLAKTFSLQFSRLQFTSDMLPADVTGISIYNQKENQFKFQPGPIFAQVLLADEINRATPKTQSALLEAMEEKKVSVDGQTYDLPNPFFVIATQNPSSQLGTFPLPESQLDRFLMRIQLGYPDYESERALLAGDDPRLLLSTMTAQLSAEQLSELQQRVNTTHCSESIINYLLNLVTATRNHTNLNQGLSPRAGIALKKAAQAWAFIHQRDFVLPEDVQAVFYAVCSHRLQFTQVAADTDNSSFLKDILESVEV